MICFHHNDLDGRCAAAIVRKWWLLRMMPDADMMFVELDYKDPVPVNLINPGEEIIIVDFSFKPEVMAEVAKRTNRVSWCDHHKTAEAYDYGINLPGIRDFSDKGLAGCEVTWNFLFRQTKRPAFVALLGDYDAWRLEHQPECFEFYEGLKLEDTAPEAKVWRDLFSDDDFTYFGAYDRIISQGKAAILYRDRYCSEIMRAFGYQTEIDGVKAYAANFYRFGSQGFVENWKKYPVCIAYIHDGQRFTVSLYSETIDVGEIAKRHGGGGHKGAAGFVCDELPFKKVIT